MLIMRWVFLLKYNFNKIPIVQLKLSAKRKRKFIIFPIDHIFHFYLFPRKVCIIKICQKYFYNHIINVLFLSFILFQFTHKSQFNSQYHIAISLLISELHSFFSKVLRKQLCDTLSDGENNIYTYFHWFFRILLYFSINPIKETNCLANILPLRKSSFFLRC